MDKACTRVLWRLGGRWGIWIRERNFFHQSLKWLIIICNTVVASSAQGGAVFLSRLLPLAKRTTCIIKILLDNISMTSPTTAPFKKGVLLKGYQNGPF